MPTYKNTSTKRQSLNNRIIEPGTLGQSFNYIDENTSGLLRVDDAPFYNPVILSTVLTKSNVVEIPKIDSSGKSVEKYAIHFSVTAGEIEVSYNSKQNYPPLLLYCGARWNVRCFERNVEKIIVESKEPFCLYIIVEKLQ